MQLIIRRDQADRRGMFGAHKGVDFSLAFQLVLSPVEIELVQRYKLEDMPLGTWIYQGTEVPITSVRGAIHGTSMQWPSVVELLSREREVKRACRTLKLLLDVASTFGGEEIVDITADFDEED